MGVKPIVTASALAIGFGALWAGPALTAESAPAAAQESQPKTTQVDTSRRICRNLVLSGTRLSRRSCRTARAWEEDAEAARRAQSDAAYDGQYRDGPQGAGKPNR
ncbi:MAG TPA: hypothetical protein VEX35_11850 [Allosphingosinicella sp.]|nr:hypothetical protein [Allosphingosinicella sp.]